MTQITERYADKIAGVLERDGARVMQYAPMKKTIYSLGALRQVLARGFNFFDPRDERLFQVVALAEFQISGFDNKAVRAHLAGFSGGQVSRLLKRWRTRGITKKARRCYKCRLTALGRPVLTLGLRIKHLAILPQPAITPAK